MKKKLFALVLAAFLAMPVFLHAEVYIDIKNMHCDNGRSYYSAPRVAQNHQYPSPPNDTSNSSSARKIVRNGQLLIVRGEEIYTISGVRIQ